MKLTHVFYRVRGWAKKLGPGFITGASDDDPSGLATYAQSGSQFGKNVFWTSVWLVPFMITVQEMAARIGMVTGEGITKSLLRKFSRSFVFLLVVLLVIANTVNISADVAGMAEAAVLVIPLPAWVIGIGLTVMMMILQVIMPYKKYVNILKWCTVTLLSYIVAMMVVSIHWRSLLFHMIVPSINIYSKTFWYMLVGIVGTTISPYLIFWQSSQEVEEDIEKGRVNIIDRRGTNAAELKKMRQDTIFGMVFSNLIMICVMAVTAAVLDQNGGHQITSMADAARALKPLAGDLAAWLFAFGVIGTGMLAIPVLAGASAYALSEFFGKPNGLYLKWHEARFFYSVIILTTSVGLGIKFYNIGAIDFLVLAAVINGFVCPLLIVAMILVASDRLILHEHVNTRWRNVLGWGTVLFFVASIVGYLVTYFW